MERMPLLPQRVEMAGMAVEEALTQLMAVSREMAVLAEGEALMFLLLVMEVREVLVARAAVMELAHQMALLATEVLEGLEDRAWRLAVQQE